jgi:LmbE family N-acetylglucosaminyl deacetylase
MNDAGSQSCVLVVVAHPDDEVLGAGGTMAWHAARGDQVHVAILADGVGARGGDLQAAQRRIGAARKAAAILGAQSPHLLAFPDNRFDAVDLLDLVKAIESIIDVVKPAVVYTHHSGDLNVDHEICHRAVVTACRPLPGSNIRGIYAMEIASSTEWALGKAGAFVPTRFVDITATMPAKRRALECYGEEMRTFPHARSFEAVESLARWRGASAGIAAAEAFMVVRDITV